MIIFFLGAYWKVWTPRGHWVGVTELNLPTFCSLKRYETYKNIWQTKLMMSLLVHFCCLRISYLFCWIRTLDLRISSRVLYHCAVLPPLVNRTANIRHLCRKTAVFSCHRCLINTGVKKWTTFKYRLEFWPLDVFMVKGNVNILTIIYIFYSVLFHCRVQLLSSFCVVS